MVSIWLQKGPMKTIFEDLARKNTAIGNKQEYGTLALQRYLLINRKSRSLLSSIMTSFGRFTSPECIPYTLNMFI